MGVSKQCSVTLACAAVVLSSCAVAQQPELTSAPLVATTGVPAPASSAAATTMQSTTSTTVGTSSTSSSTSTSVAPPCVAEDPPTEAAPASVTDALHTATQHRAFDNLDVSISVWIDGWGEVASRNPDLLLAPASNQKLLVAYAANALFEPEHQLRTTLELHNGDVVLRAAADPTLTTSDIERLAQDAVANGTTSSPRLVVDVSAYPQPPRAREWLDWQIPQYVGPLSALMIDDNRWTRDADFVADPDTGTAERVRQIFATHGLSIGAADVASSGESDGTTIAVHESEPISALVQSMLWHSDNQHGDLLLMALGRRNGDVGTLLAGGAAVEAQLAELCVPLAGTTDDGSGLSRGNLRSARELQQILRATRTTPAGERLREQLPVGGQSGTMRSRFAGADAGRVQAKTGTIIGGRSLSGFLVTDSGREAVFSIIVNGDAARAHGSLPAIDNLVMAILRA